MNDILIRSLIAAIIITVSLCLYLLHQRWMKQRAPNLLPDLGPLRPDAFTLVYFTTPNCAPCKTIQRPAIERLSNLLGSTLQVIEIDASQKPEIASRWGVLSVPTTFVIDSRGGVRHVNHGATRAEKLLMQIHDS